MKNLFLTAIDGNYRSVLDSQMLGMPRRWLCPSYLRHFPIVWQECDLKFLCFYFHH